MELWIPPKPSFLIVYVVTLRAVTHKTRRQRLKSLRASYVLQYVCSKLNRASVIYSQRHTEHAGFIFKQYFCSLIFTDTIHIAFWFKCTDLIHPFKIWQIQWNLRCSLIQLLWLDFAFSASRKSQDPMYVNGFGTELVLHNILWLIALII